MVDAFARSLSDAFDRELLPIMELLGFERGGPMPVPPGDALVRAQRVTTKGRLELFVWWRGAERVLRFGFSAHGVIQNAEDSQEHILLFPPWGDARDLQSLAAALHPKSARQIGETIEFIAGGIASSASQLARHSPDLQPQLDAARRDPRWRKAMERAVEIYEAQQSDG